MTDPVDDSGAIWPVGVAIGHTWREIGCILWVIQTYHIRAVVEVGVDQGGLAALLQAHRHMPDYMGIEIARKNVDPSVAGVIECDALSQQALDTVTWWLGEGRHPCLLYCDNGNKPKEVAFYGPILTPGDVLGVHDMTTEIQESDLPASPKWSRIRAPWVAGTRQAFIRRAT